MPPNHPEIKPIRLCPHANKRIYRVIGRDGRTQFQEFCSDCGVNPRGAGVWVPKSSILIDIETLPILKDLRPKAPSEGEPVQHGLFGGQS